jgi:anti-sigma28 factor (negative regulator of flagellin synthesis)
MAMSIRIDNDRLTGATAAQAGKTDQARSTSAKSSFAGAAQGTGKDSVEISSMAESLMNAGAVQDANRAGRVSQLAAMYASGSYQPNSLNVSRAIVEHAVNAPSEGGAE